MVDTERSLEDIAVVQKRTLRVLMIGVLPAGAATSGGFAAAATLGEELTGSDALGGLAAACLTLGGALATIPVAKIMAKHGRRIGMRSVWALGTVGALLAFVAATAEIYLLLVPGLIAMGTGSAGTLAARYAAADLAGEDRRAQAIGFLMWGQTFGAVLGPFLALGPATQVAVALGAPKFGGPYLFSAVMFAAAAVSINRLLHPDPLHFASGRGNQDGAPKASVLDAIAKIWANPGARLAVAAMITGHAVMVGIMAATPLHMKDGNQELRIVGLVISLHIVGMYMFSPVVGWLVDRLGPQVIIAAGGVILFAGAEMAGRTQAEDRPGVFAGLFLIGLGWSFGVVAASTLLTQSIPVADRVPVQGAADLLMVGAGATAGLTAGIVIQEFGYRDLGLYAGLLGLTLTLLAAFSLLTGHKYQDDSPVPG